jgi:hypothetical protein
MKLYYKQYCKILAQVIKEAKRLMYNNQVINSANKTKTTWNIIKKETNRVKGHTYSKIKIPLKGLINISFQQLKKSFRISKIM